MKNNFLILFSLSTIIFGQEYKLIKKEYSENYILVGTFKKEVLQDSNFAWWFNSEYTNYDVDTESIIKS